jgi:hypothetical protein
VPSPSHRFCEVRLGDNRKYNTACADNFSFTAGRSRCRRNARTIDADDADMKLKSIQTASYHEAGHAIAAFEMGLRLGVVRVGNNGGHVLHRSPFYRTVPHNMKYNQRPSIRRRLIERIKHSVIVGLAGREAQRRFNPRSWRRYHSEADVQAAIAMLSHISEGDELKAYFKLLSVRTRNLIALRWPCVIALAEALTARAQAFPPRTYGWTMTGDEAEQIIRTALMPQQTKARPLQTNGHLP